MQLSVEEIKTLFAGNPEQKVKVITTVQNDDGKFLVVQGSTKLYANLKVDAEDFKTLGIAGTELSFEKGKFKSVVHVQKPVKEKKVSSTSRGPISSNHTHF